MSEFDKMLEDVAWEAIWVRRDTNSDDFIEAVLKRRLLGLLEAGQAMRELPFSTLGPLQTQVEAKERWDKQKQTAMEGR